MGGGRGYNNTDINDDGEPDFGICYFPREGAGVYEPRQDFHHMYRQVFNRQISSRSIKKFHLFLLWLSDIDSQKNL